MVEYFVILGHFLMLGHLKKVRPFLDKQAYIIFYHLHINFQAIVDQYQENKDTKYADFDVSFPPRDAGTSIKTVFTARTEIMFWEVALCFHLSIMVKNK